MLASQRQAAIARLVRETGGVRVTELTELFRVSDMTIRRDLDALAREGVVHKVHGGATLAAGSRVDEPGFEAKATRQLEEKEAIAAVAASLVRPGTAIAIGAGTTTYAFARAISSIAELTIVTNSLRVADVLAAQAPATTVILTGGVRTPSDALVGPVADLTIRSLHFDTLFIGCHGMSPDAGLTAPSLAESETNRGFLHAARSVVLLADHTKWATVGLSSFAQLADVSTLVTDDDFPPGELATAREHVPTVLQPQRGRFHGPKT